MSSAHMNRKNTKAEPFPQDPTYTGPGIWFMLHLKSYHAITYHKAMQFIDDLWLVAQNHPCPVCRKNMIAYLQDNPPQDHIEYYDKSGRNIGMFRYTWLFHNYKNAELGKPTMSFEMAIEQFENNDSLSHDQGPCTEGCGNNGVSAEDIITEYGGIPMPFTASNTDISVSPGVSSFFTVQPSVMENTASPSVTTSNFVYSGSTARRPYYG